MINIIPYNHSKRIKRVRYMRVVIVSIWGMGTLIVIAALLLLPTLNTVASRYTIVNEQVHRLEQSGQVVNSNDLANLKTHTANIKEKLAAPMPFSPLAYIGTIRTYEGDGITLSGYDIVTTDTTIVTIRGVASTRERLQAFLGALQADPRIAAVDSPVANFVKSSESAFTMSITFKPV